MPMPFEVKLTPAIVREIERALSSGKSAELAVRNGKVILWSVSSKKKYELPIA